MKLVDKVYHTGQEIEEDLLKKGWKKNLLKKKYKRKSILFSGKYSFKGL